MTFDGTCVVPGPVLLGSATYKTTMIVLAVFKVGILTTIIRGSFHWPPMEGAFFLLTSMKGSPET